MLATLTVGDEVVETMTVNAAERVSALTCSRMSPEAWREEMKEMHRRDFKRDLQYFTEKRRRYPIHTASGKEHPRLRRTIIEHDLSPYPSVSAWDGFSAFMGSDLGPEGQRTFLSDGLKAQIRRMVVEGFWGNRDSL